MSKIPGGYTIWARQTLESAIFYYKPDKWFKIWFFIVNKVCHNDSKLFERGEGLITYEEIMRKTKASKPQVHKCIKYLEKENMLGFRRTTRGMIRIVLRFAFYQDPSNYSDNSKTTRQTMDGQLADNSEVLPIYNNDNNDNNEKNKRGATVAFAPPSLIEVQTYCQETGNQTDPQRFMDFYASKGWMVGKNKMRDWKAALRGWEAREKKDSKSVGIINCD